MILTANLYKRTFLFYFLIKKILCICLDLFHGLKLVILIMSLIVCFDTLIISILFTDWKTYISPPSIVLCTMHRYWVRSCTSKNDKLDETLKRITAKSNIKRIQRFQTASFFLKKVYTGCTVKNWFYSVLCSVLIYPVLRVGK